MKKWISILTTAAILLTLPSLSLVSASAASPFDNSDVRDEDIKTVAVDTLADASDRLNGNTDEKSFGEFFSDGFGKTESDSDRSSDHSKTKKIADTAKTVREKPGKINDFKEKSTGGETSSEKSDSDSPTGNTDNDEGENDIDFIVDIFAPNSEAKHEAETQRINEQLSDDIEKGVELFDGKYQQTVSESGVVTFIYESGTVVTQKPDGSYEGFDYAGRPIRQDSKGVTTTDFSNGFKSVTYSDGRSEVHMPDGAYVEFHDDGAKTVHYTDGSRDVINADGSGTSILPTGLRCDFAEDGSDNGVYYFEGGESLKITDKNGDYIRGEYTISGPNGEKLTYVNTFPDYENGDWNNFEAKASMVVTGNGHEARAEAQISCSDAEDRFSFSNKTADGSTEICEVKSTNYEDGSSLTVGTYEKNEADGAEGKGDFTFKSDKDGNEEKEFKINAKIADGSTYDYYSKVLKDANEKEEVPIEGRLDIHDADGTDIKVDMKATKNENGGVNIDMSYDIHSPEDGGGSMKLKVTSDEKENYQVDLERSVKGADGFEFNMHLSGEEIEGKSSKLNSEITYTDPENGEKGEVKINAVGDDAACEFKVIDKDGKEKNSTLTIKGEEVRCTSDDGSYFNMDKDGSIEFENKATGDYVRGNNDKIDACHVTVKDSGVTYDFKDGTGFISSADGNKVLWNYDRDSRTLAIYSSDCSYTVDEKGNLYRNGEPVRVNGVWLNVIKGYNPEDTTEPPTEETTEPPTEEITDPPTEPPTTAKQNNLDKYLGTWSYSSKKQSYTCVWTFEKKGDTLYLIISGYGGGDKTTLPCTYELSEKSMKISCAALTATVTQAGDNRMDVVTDSDSAVLTR